jgi:hypothetical protein
MATAAVSVLLDCTVSMRFSPTDLGGGESYGSLRTFKVDKVTINENAGKANHATAQDRTANNRHTGNDWEISFETKLYDPTLHALLKNNDCGQATVTAPTGLGCVGEGIITGLSWEYAGPSTAKWSISAHGNPIQMF